MNSNCSFWKGLVVRGEMSREVILKSVICSQSKENVKVKKIKT